MVPSRSLSKRSSPGLADRAKSLSTRPQRWERRVQCFLRAETPPRGSPLGVEAPRASSANGDAGCATRRPTGRVLEHDSVPGARHRECSSRASPNIVRAVVARASPSATRQAHLPDRRRGRHPRVRQPRTRTVQSRPAVASSAMSATGGRRRRAHASSSRSPASAPAAAYVDSRCVARCARARRTRRSPMLRG